MAYYCHFWRITPEQFDNLDIDAYHALGRYLKRWNEEQNRG
jgi:hypothetical protein